MDSLQKACRSVKYLFDTTIVDPVQIRVREATTSDPWGPAASAMSELADLSYTKSPVIIPDLFQRLEEENWHVVYKTLVVLDYMIKYGSETVLVDCSRNLARLLELQNCRSVEDGQDHGLNIREKSCQIVALLTDPVRLKLERAKARRIYERVPYRHAEFRAFFKGATPSISIAERDIQLEEQVDQLVPLANASEEALQLRLALAASREEEATRRAFSRDNDSPPIIRRLIIPDPEPQSVQEDGCSLTDHEAGTKPDLIDLSEWSYDQPIYCPLRHSGQGFALPGLRQDPSDSVFGSSGLDLVFANDSDGSLGSSLNLSPNNPFAADVQKAQAADLELLSKWFTP